MIVEDLEEIIKDNQLIELKVIENRSTCEYQIKFERVLELYRLYDVDLISTTLEGKMFIILSNLHN